MSGPSLVRGLLRIRSPLPISRAMGFPRPSRARLRAAFGLSALALLALVAHLAFGLGGAGSKNFFDNVVYNGLLLVASLLCLWRGATTTKERAPWVLPSLRLASGLGGWLWWTFLLGDGNNPPIPSPTDALYLGFYPC